MNASRPVILDEVATLSWTLFWALGHGPIPAFLMLILQGLL